MLVGAPGFSEISPGERVSRLVGTGEGVNALIIAPKRCPVRGVARCDARRRDAGYAVNSDASLPLIRLLPSPLLGERVASVAGRVRGRSFSKRSWNLRWQFPDRAALVRGMIPSRVKMGCLKCPRSETSTWQRISLPSHPVTRVSEP